MVKITRNKRILILISKILDKEFVQHYKKIENIDDLKTLAYRIAAILNDHSSGTSKLDMISHNNLRISRFSIDLESYQGTEFLNNAKSRSRNISSFRDSKSLLGSGSSQAEEKSTESNLFLVFEKHIAQVFWTKDRVEFLTSEASLRADKIFKKYRINEHVNSFIDILNGPTLPEDRQFLLTLSKSISLDFCRRKFETTEKKLDTFSIFQNYDWIPHEKNQEAAEFEEKDEDILDIKNGKILEDVEEKSIDSVEGRKSTLSITYNRNRVTEESSPESSNRRKTTTEHTFSSFSSTSSGQPILSPSPAGNEPFIIQMEQIDDKADSIDSLDFGKKWEEDYPSAIEYPLLSVYFNMNDTIVRIYNIGLILADLGRPIDGIIFICKSRLVIQTNYMIDSKNRLVNLVAKPEMKNYHKGKYMFSPSEMTQPFEDTTFGNKYRQTKDNFHKNYVINYEDLCEVHGKNYLAYQIGLEFWTENRIPRVLVFNHKEKSSAAMTIIKCWVSKMSAVLDTTKLKKAKILSDNFVAIMKEKKSTLERPEFRIYSREDIVKKLQRSWLSGLLSNFAYINALNSLSGRSLANLTSYFIFPQLVADFSNPPSNLKSIRTLKLPMGRHGFSEAILKQKYDGMAKMDNGFHYGVFYSHKNTTEYYLFRIFPYTQQHYNLHLGEMDSKGRMFRNFDTNFKLSSRNFFSEMIPELFYLQEYLINMNNLKFYNDKPNDPKTFNKEKKEINLNKDEIKIENVELPNWTFNDPRYFTMVHRQILESLPVRRCLHRWIDLIFGYRQNGPSSVRSFNVFRNVHYPQDPKELKMDKRTHSRFTEMFEFGNAPTVLFKDEHQPYTQPKPGNCFFASDQRLSRVLMKPVASVPTRREEIKRLTSIELLTGLENSRGPIDFLLNSLRMKSMSNCGDLYVLYGDTLLMSPSHVVVPSREGMLVSLDGKNLSIAYMDCFDISYAHYDKYNKKLWTGNSLGEIYCYEKNFISPEQFKAGVMKLKTVANSEIFATNLDQKSQICLEFISFLTLNQQSYFTVKELKSQYYKKFENYDFMTLYSKKKKNREYEFRLRNKGILRSHIDPICSLSVSQKSNVLISSDRRLKICLWDINDLKLLRKLSPPHFALLDLFTEFSQSKSPPSYLHKEFARLQVPLDFSISEENEDFVVMSKDYISLYSINGVPLSTYKRPYHENKFSCVLLADNIFNFEDHYLFVGFTNGSVKIYILGKKQQKAQFDTLYSMTLTKLSHHFKASVSLTFQPIFVIDDPEKKTAVRDIKISSNQKKLFVALDDGEVMVGEVSKRQLQGREEMMLNFQKRKKRKIITIYNNY